MMYALHVVDFTWSIYGRVLVTQAVVPFDCLPNEADPILSFDSLSTFNLVCSSLNFLFWTGFSMLCGPHMSSSEKDFQARWKKNCECLYRAMTCRSPQPLEEVFEILGHLLQQMFTVTTDNGVVRYSSCDQ